MTPQDSRDALARRLHTLHPQDAPWHWHEWDGVQLIDHDGHSGELADAILADGSRFLPAPTSEASKWAETGPGSMHDIITRPAPTADAVEALGRGFHEAGKVGGPWSPCCEPGKPDDEPTHGYGCPVCPCLCSSMASHLAELAPSALRGPEDAALVEADVERLGDGLIQWMEAAKRDHAVLEEIADRYVSDHGIRPGAFAVWAGDKVVAYLASERAAGEAET